MDGIPAGELRMLLTRIADAVEKIADDKQKPYQRKYQILSCGHAHRSNARYMQCVWSSQTNDG